MEALRYQGETAFVLTGNAGSGGGVDGVWTDGQNIDPAQHGSGNIRLVMEISIPMSSLHCRTWK